MLLAPQGGQHTLTSDTQDLSKACLRGSHSSFISSSPPQLAATHVRFILSVNYFAKQTENPLTAARRQLCLCNPDLTWRPFSTAQPPRRHLYTIKRASVVMREDTHHICDVEFDYIYSCLLFCCQTDVK